MKRKLLAFLLSLAVGGSVYAAGERSNQPIKLKADELLTDSSNRTATFLGHVSARQGDLTIYTDKLIITYLEENKDVDKVEAFGSVRVVQEDRRGEADHAIYDNRAGKITLDGNPKVYQGDDVVSGKVITYFVNDQKSVVTGGPDKRVEVTIHPKGKGKDAAARP